MMCAHSVRVCWLLNISSCPKIAANLKGGAPALLSPMHRCEWPGRYTNRFLYAPPGRTETPSDRQKRDRWTVISEHCPGYGQLDANTAAFVANGWQGKGATGVHLMR